MSTLITNTLQGINTIKYDANTTAATIDSSGNTSGSFLIDNDIPYFHARGISSWNSAAYLGVGANIVTPAVWATVDLNQGSLLNNTNGYMEAPVTGLYEYFICTQTTSDGNAGHRGLYVYQRSGSTTNIIDNAWSHNTYGYWSLISHRIVSMSAGDKILAGYHNSYSAWNTNSTAVNFWGRRIK